MKTNRLNGRMTGAGGFTLLEMLVAMVVLAIMGIAAVNLLRNQHQAQARQNTSVMNNENARAGMDMLARELRNAGYDPYRTANAALEGIYPDTIQWTADLNEDGDADDADPGLEERVKYFFDATSGTIVREAAGVQSPVADGVRSFVLTYLDNNFNVTAVAADVRHVTVTMTYDTPRGTLAGSMQTAVALRNFAYNGNGGVSGQAGPGNSGGTDDGIDKDKGKDKGKK